MIKTVFEARSALMAGSTTSEELVKNYIDEFESNKKADIPLNAFLEMYGDALTWQKKLMKKLHKPELKVGMLTMKVFRTL